MKSSFAALYVAFFVGSNTVFAQSNPTPAAFEQWKQASKEANDIFLAGRRVYDSGIAPPTCASALKSQFALGQKVEDFLTNAASTAKAMGNPHSPGVRAYWANALQTASSEVVSLDSNTEASCGLR